MKYPLIPKGIFLTGTTLFVGIFVAQILSTIHIYFSNLQYHETLTVIDNAGYLAVPNLYAAQHLPNFSPAFYGGLFFTLTTGICLSIITLFAAWVWHQLFFKKIIPLFIIITVWLASLVYINSRGFSSMITMYILFIPSTVFLIYGKLLPLDTQPASRNKVLSHITLFIVFSLICSTQMKMHWFLDIRDYLLLSNPIGESVNTFYYKNSLYSAKSFKSYSQELLKTCNLDSIRNKRLKKQLALILIRCDYLPLPEYKKPDLEIKIAGNDLELINNRKTVITAPLKTFLQSPGKSLKQFETKTDRHFRFRGLTMISLLFVGAVVLYLTVFILPFFLLNLFIHPPLLAVRIIMLCGFVLAVYLLSNATDPVYESNTISSVFTSGNRYERIKVLQYVIKNKIDISNIPAYERILSNGNIPERYWLAKAISNSHTRKTRTTLMKLLNDTQFNVVCMAFYAMGKQGNREYIPIILERLKTSKNWYEQWYAYKALRKLGWQQKQLN